jgi:hypothetical protein
MIDVKNLQEYLVRNGELPSRDLSDIYCNWPIPDDERDLSKLLKNGESCVCSKEIHELGDITHVRFGIARRVAEPDTYYELYKKGQEKSHQRIGFSVTGSWSRVYNLEREGYVEKKVKDPHHISFRSLTIRAKPKVGE